MNMKNKIWFLAVFVTLSLVANGCRTNEIKEDKGQDFENLIEQRQTETTASDSVDSDDLVYKQYMLGEKFHAGEVIISKEILTNATEEPENIIVYFNDEVIEKIEYKDTDVQINLVDDGIYCFMVTGKDSEKVDITSQVQGISYSDGGLTYLK